MRISETLFVIFLKHRGTTLRYSLKHNKIHSQTPLAMWKMEYSFLISILSCLIHLGSSLRWARRISIKKQNAFSLSEMFAMWSTALRWSWSPRLRAWRWVRGRSSVSRVWATNPSRGTCPGTRAHQTPETGKYNQSFVMKNILLYLSEALKSRLWVPT